MSNATALPHDDSTRDSWVPMIVIAMGQMLMSFNVAAIPVSMGGMVERFQTAPTTVGTAVVMYSLGVSGFVMLGAKLGQRFGSKLFFQVAVGLFLAAMVTMVLAPTAGIMLMAQGLAGLAGAALVPTLVALIANHYRGKQQAEAVGWLGSARAIAGVLAFISVGYLASIDYRLGFGLLILHAAAILVLSFKLKPSTPKPEVKIDALGVVLAAVGIICVTFGFNNLRGWGVLLARNDVPNVAGVSAAPILIVVGIAIVTGFFVWSKSQAEKGKMPLLAVEVVRSGREWATVIALFIVVAIEAAINFSVPLYIQIVQGRSSMATSLAMMPFMLTVFFTAILIVRLYTKYSPRQIARVAFILVAAGALWLSFVARNDWAVLPVIVGLITVGLGQGALVTLLFNVLVTASPKELAGDVGSLRGVTQNLAAAVGTAVMGALLVGILSAIVLAKVDRVDAHGNPRFSEELRAQVDLDNVNFLSDDRLTDRLAATSATAAEVENAVQLNADARLRTLKIGFLVLSCLAVLAIFPCSWLPNYRAGEELPADGNRRANPAPAPR